MIQTAAHLTDLALPRVPCRQWVLSVPKRVRWHLGEKPEVIAGFLRVFLRAVETTLRQRSPGAPPEAQFGAVAFVYRFGNYLNSHVHFHVLVTDGVFSGDDSGGAKFHPATDLDTCDIAAVQVKIRHRGLRWLHRHGHLDDLAVHTLDSSDHAGDGSVCALRRRNRARQRENGPREGTGGHSPGLLPAYELNRDIRGVKISQNEARPGTLRGGTMGLKFLSPTVIFPEHYLARKQRIIGKKLESQ